MATQTILEKLTGTVESASQPVYVYDDAGATLAAAAAVTAAQAAAPSSIFGVSQDANPGVEQLADFGWRITITYRVRSLRNLSRISVGGVRYDFDVQAKPKLVRWAPEVAAFPPDNFPSQQGVITANGLTVQPHGVPINPPTPNAGAQGIVAATDITASWVASMRRLVGTVNQQAISNWSAGEVFLNRVSVQQVDDDEVNIRVQWTLGDAVTNETRGEITGISYKPFQHVREWIGIDADRDGNTLVYKPTAVLVNDVWPWGYHILLGINPPDKNA